MEEEAEAAAERFTKDELEPGCEEAEEAGTEEAEEENDAVK